MKERLPTAERLAECYGSAKDALRYLRDGWKPPGMPKHIHWQDAGEVPLDDRKKESKRRTRIVEELEALACFEEFVK